MVNTLHSGFERYKKKYIDIDSWINRMVGLTELFESNEVKKVM